jgi:branched-chain amino acid transport system substrate-binding protein
VGGLAAHVQMAINEQAKAAGKIFISISQSDEISAKPDSGPLTFHEALNPTITGRAVGSWAVKNVGKKFWIVYADYAWGKQNNAVFTDVIGKAGGTVLGSTPYPLGKPEFSTHFPKILAAKPEALITAVPGNDAIAFMKQAISFGVKQQAQIVWPLHFLDLAKTVGLEAFADTYGGTSFYWELQDSIPEAKKYVDAFTKKFNRPPDSYSGYGYSGIMEVVRGVELAKSTNSDAVATALLNSPRYAHYKTQQWWRKCDRKGFQDLWIVKGRKQLKGDWGYFDTVAKVAADEALDRTCGEKGYA